MQTKCWAASHTVKGCCFTGSTFCMVPDERKTAMLIGNKNPSPRTQPHIPTITNLSCKRCTRHLCSQLFHSTVRWTQNRSWPIEQKNMKGAKLCFVRAWVTFTFSDCSSSTSLHYRCPKDVLEIRHLPGRWGNEARWGYATPAPTIWGYATPAPTIHVMGQNIAAKHPWSQSTPQCDCTTNH